MMLGTLLNAVAILVGGGLGILFGDRLSAQTRQTVIYGLGLFIIASGLQMFLKTQNALLVLGSLLLGGLIGEGLQIQARLEGLGAWLEARVQRNGSAAETARFIKGFVSSSLLFCIGPMAILGSIQAGLEGNITILAIKSTLDGFASLAFAATLGVGVLFASLPILLYQGSITLLAGWAQHILSAAMINELTATGGLLIMAIGISGLLELKPVRLGNFLPALLLAPLFVAGLATLPSLAK